MRKLLLLLLPLSAYSQGVVRQIPTISDLSTIKPLSSAVNGQLTLVVGDTGRVLHWDTGSAETVDNGCVFAVSVGGGRFIATDCLDGLINIKFYGAAGDGLTDDTAAYTAALSRATSVNGTLLIPAGSYLVSSTNIYGPQLFSPTRQLTIRSSLLVTGTNTAPEHVGNAYTLNGVRITAWPTGDGSSSNVVFTPVVYCPDDDTWHELSAMKLGDNYLVAIEQTGTNSITPSTYASSKALNLKSWAMADSYAFQSVTYSAGTAITNAVISWPDGGTGVLSVLNWNGSFEAIDEYTATHTNYNMTVHQGRMYRDATSGVITNRPVPTVTSP